MLLNANSMGLKFGWLISLTYTIATVVNPAVTPAMHRATQTVSTDLAVAIISQERTKGKQEKTATFFLPNLSINGPTASEPKGRAMVTRLAASGGQGSGKYRVVRGAYNHHWAPIQLACSVLTWKGLSASSNCGNRIAE